MKKFTLSDGKLVVFPWSVKINSDLTTCRKTASVVNLEKHLLVFKPLFNDSKIYQFLSIILTFLYEMRVIDTIKKLDKAKN